jgi:hypothetical protein
MKKTLIYLHGFLSSGNAVKACIFREFLSRTYPDVELLSPDIDNNPLKAYASIKDFLKDKNTPSGVVGSSLGGFWARMLARELNIPGVLLNPVVRADRLVEERLGQHMNSATGEVFTLTEDTVAGIRGAEDEHDEKDIRLLRVYLGTMDEVLDYKLAQGFFAGCDIRLLEGETHRVLGFESLCPEIAEYLLGFENI